MSNDLYEFNEWVMKRERDRREKKQLDALLSVTFVLTIILTIIAYVTL